MFFIKLSKKPFSLISKEGTNEKPNTMRRRHKAEEQTNSMISRGPNVGDKTVQAESKVAKTQTGQTKEAKRREGKKDSLA